MKAAVFSILFFLLIFTVPAHAMWLGRPPNAQREIIFEPNAHYESEYSVGGSAIIESYITGDPEMLPYFTLVDPAQNSGSRALRVIIDLPASMPPGTYHVVIGAGDMDVGDGQIVTRTRVEEPFTVYVYDTPKYAEITGFAMEPISKGTDANYTLWAQSKTTTDINAAFAKIELFDKDGMTVLKTTNTPIKPLPNRQSIMFTGSLQTEDLASGDYVVNATLFYDENVTPPRSTVLRIGAISLELVNYTNVFFVNQTNKFMFTVKNQWNLPQPEVSADVQIMAQNKRTSTFPIGAFSLGGFETYFDRNPEVGVGTLTGAIVLHYEDEGKPVSQSYPVSVEMVDENAVVAQGLSWKTIGIAGGSVILLLLLLLFLKRKKKDEQPPAAPPQVQG